ncbi:MAG TPA: glycosyltransferase, partial [Pontibacter sp.]
MSEKRILLASLLKPVNDTRMYGKLGLSLSKLPQVQVHLTGFLAPLPPDAPDNLHFHPIFSFKRLSTGRFTAQRKYWQLLKTIKPDLLIVCTHELLLASWLYCKTHRCELVYDVQENYSLNLTAQDSYNPVLKKLLAKGVRTIENLTAPTIAHFFLAEQSYALELPFIGSRFTIVENKYKPTADYKPRLTPVQLSGNKIRLLYSGTISRIYGIFEAIALADTWHRQNPNVT